MNTDPTQTPAVAGPVELPVRPDATAPRWWHCDTHGAGTLNAWGCPECVREMRGEIQRLNRELGECTGTLQCAGQPIEWQRKIDAAVAAERERWMAACDAERAEFAERAVNNDGGRQSDFAFGSLNSAERIKAAGLGPNVELTGLRPQGSTSDN